jgi:peptide/nickel transport system ATP-binding protein
MTSTVDLPAEQLPESTDAPILEVQALVKHFPVRRRGRAGLSGGRQVVHATCDVSFNLERGKIVAVVGESGSGKSTIAKVLARIDEPSGGKILLDGEDATKLKLRDYLTRVQMIFQDPFASLNPIHSVEHHLARPLILHRPKMSKEDLHKEVIGLLERVSLTPAEQFAAKKPHELSGGQRQRVSIARALAVQPDVLLADEPVSMLDVSIRLGVLNLLQKLGHDERIALLYITHDIASARYFADSIQVMYAGRLVEGGPAEEVTQNPAHPYTQLLIDSAPDPDRRDGIDPRAERLGEMPNLVDPPSGCRFHPRCPQAMDVCKEKVPPAFPTGDGHWAACWLHSEGTTAVPVQISTKAPAPAPEHDEHTPTDDSSTDDPGRR